MVEQLDEHPLGPFVVCGVGGTHLAVPVEGEADLVELLAVAGDVLAGGEGGVLARLDGVLLGGEAEGVVAHRVQHVEPFLPFVAGVDVGCDVPEGVPDVQARARRIGEHVQNIELRFPDMDRDAALRTMMYYITNNFRNLDVNNYEAGWIRTKWNIDKFSTMQIRTRIELKQAPSDGDGLLKFDLLIESQKAAPNVEANDQNFKDWNLVLKKYKKISEDIRKSVEAIDSQKSE